MDIQKFIKCFILILVPKRELSLNFIQCCCKSIIYPDWKENDVASWELTLFYVRTKVFCSIKQKTCTVGKKWRRRKKLFDSYLFHLTLNLHKFFWFGFRIKSTTLNSVSLVLFLTFYKLWRLNVCWNLKLRQSYRSLLNDSYLFIV